MLDAHPRIQFLGETSFLLPRIWREVWEDRFWLNFPLYTALRPRSSRETPPVADKSAIDAERERVAAALRRFVCDILKVRPDVESWGYKELWNGSDAVGRYSWESYDAVFPGATWVHLVRHPFDFLVSIARWNLHPLTEDFVVHELTHWAQMLEWNRARSVAGAFLRTPLRRPDQAVPRQRSVPSSPPPTSSGATSAPVPCRTFPCNPRRLRRSRRPRRSPGSD